MLGSLKLLKRFEISEQVVFCFDQTLIKIPDRERFSSDSQNLSSSSICRFYRKALGELRKSFARLLTENFLMFIKKYDIVA